MTGSRWARLDRRVVIAASVGLALVLVSAVALADSDGSAASNEAAAHSDATELLSKLVLPPGAKQSSTEPAGDHSALAGPSSFPATGNLVDLHRWWLVTGSPHSAIAYIRAHGPRGSNLNETSTSSGDSATFVAVGYGWPSDLRVLASRELLIGAVQLPGGVTGLRVDAQDVWLTPRPASELIPSRVARLGVTVTRANRRRQGPLTFTSATRLRAVVMLLNSLPAYQPGAQSCPADWGTVIRLRFYAAHGRTPTAEANVHAGGCGAVQLNLGGQRQGSLASFPIPGHPHATLTTLLGRALGVRFVRFAP